MSKLKYMLNDTEGKWVAQQTIYYLKNKRKSVNTFKIQIFPLFDKQNLSDSNIVVTYGYYYTNNNNKSVVDRVSYSYNYVKSSIVEFGTIKRTSANGIKTYSFSVINKNCLSTDYSTKNHQYKEFLYSISKNFRISIVIIKKNNRCIAICFTSTIKVLKS